MFTKRTLVLEAKTMKGNDALFIHGKEWLVITESNHVQQFYNRPGILICSLKNKNIKRWIETTNDYNFSYKDKENEN